jgi:hypothetical protein
VLSVRLLQSQQCYALRRISVPAIFMDHLSAEMRRALALADEAGDGVLDGMGNPAGHRPGFCYGSAGLRDQAVKARDNYLRNLGEAWKHPEREQAQQPRSRANDGAAAHARYVQRISNAWRQP